MGLYYTRNMGMKILKIIIEIFKSEKKHPTVQGIYLKPVGDYTTDPFQKTYTRPEPSTEPPNSRGKENDN